MKWTLREWEEKVDVFIQRKLFFEAHQMMMDVFWMYFDCVAVLRKDTTRLSISQNVLIANSKTKESVNSTTKTKERNVVARDRLVNFDVWYENCKPVL